MTRLPAIKVGTSTKQTVSQSSFVCKVCHKSLTSETRFLNHKCPQMKRDEEFRTPTGQTAWHYYQLWMRAMKRLPPPGPAFKTSKYFRTFINFVLFAQKVSLPRVDQFIRLMSTLKYPPTMWMSNDVYVIYIEHLDKQATGVEQATLSAETILAYCDKKDIDIADVFDVMPIQEVIHLLHVRKLSPWLLLSSNKFKKAYATRANPEQQIMIESLIRPDHWPDQFEKYPDQVAQIKRLVAGMEL